MLKVDCVSQQVWLRIDILVLIHSLSLLSCDLDVRKNKSVGHGCLGMTVDHETVLGHGWLGMRVKRETVFWCGHENDSVLFLWLIEDE